MKQLILVTSLLLFLASVGQTQTQHQIGFETGVAVNKLIYSVPEYLRPRIDPDLSSQFTPGFMAALKYDLLLSEHFHLGVGIGAEAKEAYEQEIETANLLLPVEVGYRSALIGNMYLTGDLVFMPHLVVRNGRTIYYFNNQTAVQESEFLPIDHRPLNIQLGAKLGAGWKLSERLDLQLSVLGRADLFKDVSKDTLFDKRYWGIQFNVGLRWNL